MYTYKNIQLERLGHDGFLITYNNKTICIDPYEINHSCKADYLFITHSHSDHLSIDDIQKIIKPNTVIVAAYACKEQLDEFTQKKFFLKPNEKLVLPDFSLTTIPAYNTNKFREPGVVFHMKEALFLGFLFDVGGTSVYHAGDTDIIPEMKGLSPDIALLPVSGVYTMTAQEAVESLKLIKPKIAIPMHYGKIVGNANDALYFQKHANCEVVLL